MTTESIRTQVRDAILADVTADLATPELQAVEDAAVLSTEEACWNRHYLVDFEDEYRRGAL